MPFTSLKERLDALPLVLAGPILRRIEPGSVTVWLALKEQRTVALRIFSAEGQEVLRGTSSTIKLGDNLYLVAVTAQREPAGTELSPGTIYTYDLFDSDGQSLIASELAHLTYPDGPKLPSFVLPPADLNKLRLVHASCRMPHGQGRDMLARLDGLIQDSVGNPDNRPQQLFLTGDQIYADDVADSLLWMITDAAKTLLQWEEQLPGVDDVSDAERKKQLQAQLSPGKRQDLTETVARFTSGEAKSHLVRLGEFHAMYLFAWSPVLWPDSLDDLPDAEKVHPGRNQQVPSSVAPVGGVPVIVMVDAPWYEEFKAELRNLKEFYKSLPQVRRVLANIPTYMMFDDHEVTDDLFLDRAWCQAALRSPLGRRVIQNGLAAYALFQAWGNTPEQFQDEDEPEKQPPGQQLLNLFPKLQDRNKLDEYLGLPNDTDVDDWKPNRLESLDPKDTALPFHFAIRGPNYQVLFLNIRSHRAFPADKDNEPDESTDEKPAELISKKGLERQVPESLQGKVPLTFVVSPTPVFGVEWIEWWQEQAKRFKSRVFADYERWNLGPDALARLLFGLADLGSQSGDKQQTRVVILSGDVHYGFAARVEYSDDNANATFAQFTASSLKNQAFKPLAAQLRGYGREKEPLEVVAADGRVGSYSLSYQPGDQNPGVTKFSTLDILANILGSESEFVPEGSQIVGYNNLGEIRVAGEGQDQVATQVLHWSTPEGQGITTTYNVSLTIVDSVLA